MDTNTNTRKFRYIPRNEILYGAPEVAEPYEKKEMSDMQNSYRPMSIQEYSAAERAAAARKRQRAAGEFTNGKLHIANGCSYSLNDFETKLNNNVLVVGGSGTGKTRTVVTPNIHEAVGSYIISDPKGNLHKKYGGYLRRKGYNIRVMDFTHPERSAHYNPMMNLKSSQDIIKLATLLVNEKETDVKDPFWDNSAALYLNAIIGYMLETGYKPFDFRNILELMRQAERSDDCDKNSVLLQKFEALKMRDPDSWACSQFESANSAPYKTYDCIRATLASKFAKFDTIELQKMMSGNDFDFTDIAKEKTALFVIVSDTDRTMDELVNIFFTQAMQALCSYADEECADSRLPVPVRFILDDFATNCRINEFPRIISTIRSRGISVMLMVQAESQLVHGYGENASTIISNCDTYVYLGGNDLGTAQSVSIRCNKPLDQVLNMPIGSCWVFRRGSRPEYTTVIDAGDAIREMAG